MSLTEQDNGALQVARIRCSIREAEYLQAAEAAANDEEFDLAVLDYDLPDGTGHDLIRILHRSPLNSQISIVMITGNNSVRISEGMACISKECLSPDDLKHVFTRGVGQETPPITCPCAINCAKTASQSVCGMT